MNTYHIDGYVIEAKDEATAALCALRLVDMGVEKDYHVGEAPPPLDFPAWMADDELDQVTENLGGSHDHIY